MRSLLAPALQEGRSLLKPICSLSGRSACLARSGTAFPQPSSWCDSPALDLIPAGGKLLNMLLIHVDRVHTVGKTCDGDRNAGSKDCSGERRQANKQVDGPTTPYQQPNSPNPAHSRTAERTHSTGHYKPATSWQTLNTHTPRRHPPRHKPPPPHTLHRG